MASSSRPKLDRAGAATSLAVALTLAASPSPAAAPDPQSLPSVSLLQAVAFSGPAEEPRPRGQQDVYLELRSRAAARPVTLALPMLRPDPGAEADAARLHEVLWNNLHYSMVFDLVPEESYPGPDNGSPDWLAWRRTGAEALILGQVRRAGDGILALFRLYDVKSGDQVTGESFAEPAARTRAIAHAFSDEAVLYYTGIPGVAETKVAFVSDREGSKEVFVMDYDGYAQQRITYDGFLALGPAFSPHADRIAYVAYRMHGGIPDEDIAVLHQGGGRPTPVATAEGLDTAPSWSPDGEWMAFSSARHGNPEIYVMRYDGSDVRRLTQNSAIDTSPTWSPNGRQIAFISKRGGAQHLYVMDRDGANVRRLRVQGGQIDDPAWNPISPDLIAYTGSIGGNNFEIFVYDLVAGQSYPLTRGFGRDEAPTWSPDGRQIAFETTQGAETQIYAMGIDGSRLRKLTRQGNNNSPSWGGRR